MVLTSTLLRAVRLGQHDRLWQWKTIYQVSHRVSHCANTASASENAAYLIVHAKGRAKRRLQAARHLLQTEYPSHVTVAGSVLVSCGSAHGQQVSAEHTPRPYSNVPPTSGSLVEIVRFSSNAGSDLPRGRCVCCGPEGSLLCTRNATPKKLSEVSASCAHWKRKGPFSTVSRKLCHPHFHRKPK